MDGREYSPTPMGTPQGGVISPVLMNVALHGMETAIKEGYAKRNAVEKPLMVRYADDFVIFHSNLEELQRAARRVTEWLEAMGLHLSPKETRMADELFPPPADAALPTAETSALQELAAALQRTGALQAGAAIPLLPNTPERSAPLGAVIEDNAVVALSHAFLAGARAGVAEVLGGSASRGLPSQPPAAW